MVKAPSEWCSEDHVDVLEERGQRTKAHKKWSQLSVTNSVQIMVSKSHLAEKLVNAVPHLIPT